MPAFKLTFAIYVLVRSVVFTFASESEKIRGWKRITHVWHICYDYFCVNRYSGVLQGVAAGLLQHYGSRRAGDYRAVMRFYVKSNYGAAFSLPL